MNGSRRAASVQRNGWDLNVTTVTVCQVHIVTRKACDMVRAPQIETLTLSL